MRKQMRNGITYCTKNEAFTQAPFCVDRAKALTFFRLRLFKKRGFFQVVRIKRGHKHFALDAVFFA